MLDLAYVLVMGTIGIFLIGYLTPKFAVWGTLGMGMMWMTAHIIPEFSPGEVTSTVGPAILDLFVVYPKAIGVAFDGSLAADGILGGIAVIVLAIIWLVPYLLGMFLGLVTWPELLPFRVIL